MKLRPRVVSNSGRGEQEELGARFLGSLLFINIEKISKACLVGNYHFVYSKYD